MTELVTVVPARNEEQRIGSCLTALAQAAAELAAHRPGVRHRVVVVLDRCTDDTADVVREFPHTVVVTADVGRVGAARAIGMATALQLTSDPEQTWLACTDADSQVPLDWLLTQHTAADDGIDLLLGTVRPQLGPLQLRSWLAAHDVRDGHPHVHGANLGIRGSVYRRAGGFAALAAHEDVLLAGRVRELGARVVATAASPVLTSARTDGRTGAGFANWMSTFLQESLLAEPLPASATG